MAKTVLPKAMSESKRDVAAQVSFTISKKAAGELFSFVQMPRIVASHITGETKAELFKALKGG